jgi:hypothetical protein
MEEKEIRFKIGIRLWNFLRNRAKEKKISIAQYSKEAVVFATIGTMLSAKERKKIFVDRDIPKWKQKPILTSNQLIAWERHLKHTENYVLNCAYCQEEKKMITKVLKFEFM